MKKVIGICEHCRNKVVAEIDPRTNNFIDELVPSCEFCKAEMLVELPVIKMAPAPSSKEDNILAFKTRP